MSHGRPLKVASGLQPSIPQLCFMIGDLVGFPSPFCANLHQSAAPLQKPLFLHIKCTLRCQASTLFRPSGRALAVGFCERCHRDWCLGFQMWFCYNKTNELLGLLFYVQLKSHCQPLESETNYFLRYRNNGWTRETPGPLHTSQLLSH